MARRTLLRAVLPVLLALAGWSGGSVPAPAVEVGKVEIVGTAFRITLADGRVLTGAALVGAVLDVADDAGNPLTVRINGHRPDPLDPSGETVLYALSTPDPAAPGGWTSLCRPGPDGLALGFPLAGAWTADGRHVAAPGSFGITCTAGAVGKCVRFGYRPWQAGPDGRPLWDLHQACVRLVRADYCGDGLGHTRDGTPIDISDRLGIQVSEATPEMGFEAAFGPEGAVCVRRTRLPDVLDLDRLAATCPRLVGRLGETCTENAPAPLLVRSVER